MTLLVRETSNIIDNNRAISISPVLLKMFEYCVLSRHSKYLETSPNQFGFKKDLVVVMPYIQLEKLLNIMCLEVQR